MLRIPNLEIYARLNVWIRIGHDITFGNWILKKRARLRNWGIPKLWKSHIGFRLGIQKKLCILEFEWCKSQNDRWIKNREVCTCTDDASCSNGVIHLGGFRCCCIRTNKDYSTTRSVPSELRTQKWYHGNRFGYWDNIKTRWIEKLGVRNRWDRNYVVESGNGFGFPDTKCWDSFWVRSSDFSTWQSTRNGKQWCQLKKRECSRPQLQNHVLDSIRFQASKLHLFLHQNIEA